MFYQTFFSPQVKRSTSETMPDYHLQTWDIRVSSRVPERLKTQDIRKLGNIRRVLKSNRMIAQPSVNLQNRKFGHSSKDSGKTDNKLFA